MLNIAIAGAGPAGLAAALRLSTIPDVSITVYERDSSHRTAGGAINLAPNAMRLVDRLGASDEAYQVGHACPTFELLSESGAKLGYIPNTASDGHPGMRVMRSALQEVLLKKVQEKGNVEVQLGKKLKQVEENEDGVESEGKGRVSMTFADGSTAHADLLIGADGISSAVRSYVAGDKNVTAEYTGRTVVYGVVNSPSRIMQPGKIWSMHATSAVLSRTGLFMYAFAEPTRSKIYWFTHDESQKDANGGHVAKLANDITRGQFMERFERCFEPMPSLVKYSDEFYSWPIHTLPKLDYWSRGSVVLVGDAAHAVSPHRGQGVAMALEDVFVLAKVIEKAVNNKNNGDAKDRDYKFEWETYEKIRMPRVNRLRDELKNTKSYSEGKSAVGAWARDWIAWTMLRATPVWMMRYMSMELHEYDPDKEVV